MASLDDPVPGRKSLYTHIVPITNLKNFLMERKLTGRSQCNKKYDYNYKVMLLEIYL